jgi:hypothetical protein
MIPPPTKLGHIPPLNSPITNGGIYKVDDNKAKPGTTDFLPKKLPFKDTKKLS